MSTVLDELPGFILALLKQGAYTHPCSEIELVETHISWVILTGQFVYKIKKPVNFGFLDFSTLEKRKQSCCEEIRLNSRTAPDVYLDVVSVSRSKSGVVMEQAGDIFEYAVKMKQFEQSHLLDRQLEDGSLTGEKIDQLADVIATFHSLVAISNQSDDFGTPATDHRWAMENFEQLEKLINDPQRRRRIESLKAWTQREFQDISSTLSWRKEKGFVRECHGDLHLRNITEIDSSVVLFDGIEFNPHIRWIDVMNELAFLFTDLEHRKRSDLAWRVLNRYLEQTGDYRGLRVFRYFRLYRIMVRAKIDALRLDQVGLEEQERIELEADIDIYLAQGEKTIAKGEPSIVLMRGLSGSGKSFLSQQILEHSGMLRVRSDVERKRLRGLLPQEKTPTADLTEMYSPKNSRETFDLLLEHCRSLSLWGYPVIMDATFLQIQRIEVYLDLALDLKIPFHVLDLRVPESVLRERIRSRALEPGVVSEATEAVLNTQLSEYFPLEGSYVLAVDGVSPWSVQDIVQRLSPSNKIRHKIVQTPTQHQEETRSIHV